MLVLAAVAALVARDDRSLPGDVPAVPTPPDVRNDREATPLPDPFAYDDGPQGRVREARRGGLRARALRPLAGRGGRDGAARGALAPADRGRGGRGRRAARPARGAGVPRERRPRGRDGGRHGGRRRAHPDPRRDGPEPAEDARRRRGAAAATRAASGARCCAGGCSRSQRLRSARRKVDQRFDPAQALAGTARYLKLAKARFHRDDMAFVSYHMGMGNLESVLRAYGTEPGDEDVSYTQVYFDSTPQRNAAAQRKLASFGDDSSNYLWKLGSAREIMRLHREDAGELARAAGRADRQGLGRGGAAPAGLDDALHDARDAAEGVGRRRHRGLPRQPARAPGSRRDARMGELAGRLGQKPSLYEGLRPEALATALYIGAQTRAFSGEAPLTVTSTVRDEAYQRRLVARNREATRNYSLHTTGWAFDLARRYRSKPPGAGLPVRARPPADARRDRLGARARRDPRDRRAGGEGPAPVARASTTLGMTDAIRTPDQILEGLPDFPYEPHYRTVDGLRLAHVDEGDGAPVVMWHGEPTWGYLWRHVLPPVRDAGHRVVLPGPRRLRALGQADGARLVLLRPPRGDRRDAARGPRRPRRDLRRPRLGRADRAAPRGRAPRARRAARDPRQRRVQRRVADERRLAAVRGLRRAHRGPADRPPGPPRLPPRPRRRGRRRLRRAVSEHRLDGRRARLPPPDPAAARRARARPRAGGCWRRCARISARR